MNVGSLFSGIGGFDLGLERAGMRTVWFCEQDEFCQRVLARHWPGVPCYSDVRSLVADTSRLPEIGVREETGANGERVGPRDQSGGAGREVPVPVPPIDVLCGGFPCQDLSVAGKGAGLDGERSGLWSEYARLIGELRPRYVIVENVPALLARGFGRVLGDLAALGYDAEWDCLPASAFGAPHRRDRVWVVAYPGSEGQRRLEERNGPPTERERQAPLRNDPDGRPDLERGYADAGDGSMADPNGKTWSATGSTSEAVLESCAVERLRRCGSGEGSPWATEPNVGRVANGVPARVDRLRSLGNALLPQIAEWIGSRVMEYERQTNPVRW